MPCYNQNMFYVRARGTGHENVEQTRSSWNWVRRWAGADIYVRIDKYDYINDCSNPTISPFYNRPLL